VEKKYRNKDKKSKSKKGGKAKVVLLLFAFLNFSLTGFRVRSTNAYFSDTLVSSGNTFSAGWWADDTAPTSEIDQEVLGATQNLTDFSVSYFAEDEDGGSGVKEVRLYYSYNLGDWTLFAEVSVPNEFGEGAFNFTSPLGDGVYDFKTIAVDNAGNTEEKHDVDASTQVDTEPPTMNLSLPAIGDDRWAGQNLAENGSFEKGMTDWVAGGDGDHHIVGDGQDLYGGFIGPRDGNDMFVLGFKDSDLQENASDWLYQEVDLPVSSSANLSFDWRMISDDMVDYDQFSVWIKDNNGYSLERILTTGSGGLDVSGWVEDSGWREITHSLLNFAGRSIKIWFELINSGEAIYRSWTYIDGVKITTIDNRITENTPVDFEIHDGSGSGEFSNEYQVDDDTPDTYGGSSIYLAAGGHSVANGAEDIAGNVEPIQNDDLVVQPAVVINAFSAAPTTTYQEWVTLFNNSGDDIDVNSWEICDNADHCQVLNVTNSETNSTTLPKKSTLKFVDNFQLNNNGDKIILKNDLGNKQDDFKYPSLGGSYDLIWQRNPDGIGSWELIKPSIDAHITSRYDRSHKILLSIFNIPDEHNDGDDLLEYEITYFDDADEEKGISGMILSGAVEDGKADREFYLGICSSGGICVPDIVKDRKIYLTLKKKGIIIIDQREFGI